MNTTLMA